MKKKELIIMHCSATKPSTNYTVDRLGRDHAARGFAPPYGYHFYYTKDGVEHVGRTTDREGAHAKGFNHNIGICYEGGLNENGEQEDTRTPAQKAAIAKRILLLREEFGPLPVVGHRDLSPDINKDGIIQEYERLKGCPCYEAIDEHNTAQTLKPFLIKYLNQ